MESFIVRVMPNDDDDGALRGVLRRVADGWETTFADADELLVLLRSSGSESPAQEASP